ncbi:hypothetical protein [Neptuniibacter sp. QD37_11]|uniref:hypothetical protein n=1 Tax=Neptuniibacter sp. QD37_11 TaxID=3398209 RepID=UPI0039F5F6EC
MKQTRVYGSGSILTLSELAPDELTVLARMANGEYFVLRNADKDFRTQKLRAHLNEIWRTFPMLISKISDIHSERYSLIHPACRDGMLRIVDQLNCPKECQPEVIAHLQQQMGIAQAS